MKMGFLDRLFGRTKKGRGKTESGQRKIEKPKDDQYTIMPDFKSIFAAMPKTIKATAIEQKDEITQNAPSLQDQTAAKIVAEREAKTASVREKMKDVQARIRTARNKHMEIIWLLQASTDVPYKSLSDLIAAYENVKGSVAYRGMSVNYASDGKLRQISALNEEDLKSLAQKTPLALA